MKSKLIKTDIRPRIEFTQPIERAFYIQEKENKYYLTDLKEISYKISYKLALKLINI